MAYKIKSDKRLVKQNPKLNFYDYHLIAHAQGLNREQTLIYTKFMQKRFPQEFSVAYAREWAERFKRGTPEAYMDELSGEIYNKVKK